MLEDLGRVVRGELSGYPHALGVSLMLWVEIFDLMLAHVCKPISHA